MKKHVLALMDSEEPYAVRFMEHINRRKASPFEVHAFTDRDKLKAYARTHRIEMLLISEHDLSEQDQVAADRTVVLTDGAGSCDLYPNICKYQAASAVMREIMEVYGAEPRQSDAASGTLIKPTMKIIGIFSPVGRCMKTSFALALGQCLARNRASLYLNLETSSGFRTLFQSAWEHDISDVIYYIRRKDPHITARLLPLIREIGSLGIVPPSPSPAEIYTVTAEEWHELFESLRRDSSYEILVLDLGELPLLYPDLLEECDLIYMPVREDETAKAKIAEFEEVSLGQGSELASRVRKLHLAPLRLAVTDAHWAERLPYGPLGAAAEERIAADGI